MLTTSKKTWLAFSFLLLPFSAMSQFSVSWQKPLALCSADKQVKELTCISKVGDYQFIGYVVNWAGKNYPALSILYPGDSLKNLTNFSSNESLDGYRIVSVVRTAADTITAFCNKTDASSGRPKIVPAEMVFEFKNGKINFLRYEPIPLTDAETMSSVRVADAVQAGAASYYLAIQFVKPGNSYVNIYSCQGSQVSKSRTITDAADTRLWWGDDKNLVLSSETPFRPGSSKRYYEIQVLNENLATVRKYPPTLEYLDSNAADRLVELSYRPLYHVGMVARQVQDIKGVNRLNWYAFNGFPDGTHNKISGENSDLIIGENTVHPYGEKIVFNYGYPGGNQNNWVFATAHFPGHPHNSLILSVERFDGLELVRDTFGQASDDIIEKMKDNPALLKNIGVADIDAHYPDVKCFAAGTGAEVYVVHNRPRKTLEQPGIVISKYTLDTNDPRLADNYLTTTYGRPVYYAKTAIGANDDRKWQIAGLAPDDPLLGEKDNLINQEMRLASALTPIENTWYWQGDVKIGRRKYHLTKAVLAKP